MYKQICKECSIDFKSKGPNKIFCSKECKIKFNSKTYTYTECSNCKNQVRYFPNSAHKHNKDVFCSNLCQGEWRKENMKDENIKLASKMRESWNEESWKKSIETRKKNGNIITNYNWKQYWKRCDWLTRKIRKQMLENWDGYDYISKEYIKDNLNLHYSHGDYPTLDHIKPRSQCFKEGLSPYEATKPENLAWTTRKNNSKKSQKKLK
jgi:hypothetical protein